MAYKRVFANVPFYPSDPEKCKAMSLQAVADEPGVLHDRVRVKETGTHGSALA